MLTQKTMTHRTKWQSILTSLSLLLVALMLLGPLAASALAQAAKVAVCHLNSDGNYIPINIADPALDSHRAHGDLVVGEEADENCQPLDRDGDGVLDASDNCVDVANPGQEDRYGSSAGDACEDLDGDGTPDVNEPNFCLSIDSVLLASRGTATCLSTATIGQEPNVALANGDSALADVSYGNNNRATAIGYNAVAGSIDGNNNRATAIGNDARARADFGDNNSATATGDGALAYAIFGNNNSATATGDGAYATAGYGDNNNATSTGVYTCAGNGDSGETAVNEDLCIN